MKKIYWKIGLSILAVFFAGMAVGSVVTLRVIQTKTQQWMKPESFAKQALDRLDHRLHLTADQHQKVEKALQELTPEWKNLNEKQVLERRHILEEFQKKISVYLDDEQNKQMEELRQQRMRRVHQILGVHESYPIENK